MSSWSRLCLAGTALDGSGWISLDPVGSSWNRLCPAGAASASPHGTGAWHLHSVTDVHTQEPNMISLTNTRMSSSQIVLLFLFYALFILFMGFFHKKIQIFCEKIQ